MLLTEEGVSVDLYLIMRNEELAFNKGYRIDDNGDVHGLSGQKLKPWVDSWGYKNFKVGKYINLSVHRLMAYQLFGDKLFEKDKEVRHSRNASNLFQCSSEVEQTAVNR